jgi:DNA-binding NarL/FixJ family response regulator
MNILIVDDHAIVRKGIAQALEQMDAVLDEASSGQEALEKISANDYQLVLLDISMPGRNGIETLTLIKNMRPLLPVLILTSYPEDHYAIRAMKSGASGYLTKNCTTEELIAAAQKVAFGQKHVSANLLDILVDEVTSERQKSNALHELLSNREYQIARMIASGKTVGQIADELALSVKTVSTYRARLLDKLDIRTNAGLTAYMVRQGFID